MSGEYFGNNMRSDTGPVGPQLRGPLGLDDAEDIADLVSSETRRAIRLRGLELRGVPKRGGYGVVYRARDTSVGQQRAVKIVIDPSSQTSMRTFDRECAILASLSELHIEHSAVPRFYFSEMPPLGQPFLVMEWINGVSIEEYVTNKPSLPMHQREAICEAVFRAYQQLHDVNIIHRDVSLRNTMVEAGRIRLIDFGSAGRANPGYMSVKSMTSVPVTAAFASDEVVGAERRATIADDVHAVAKCCFFVLTGHRAYTMTPGRWKPTLREAGVHPELINDVILPRMQQPPTHDFA